MAKISVIVPVYNVESYLADCLDSILKQSFMDIEVICINDGSSDGSLEILEKYAKKDSRIQIVSQENQGLSGARNTGIEYATGKYLCFVDSDDMLAAGALQKIFDSFQKEDADLICYNTSVLYESETLAMQDNKKDYFRRKEEYLEPATGIELFEQMMGNEDFCVAAWLLAVKIEWIRQKGIRFENGIIHEDNKYCIECYLNASIARYIPDELYIYRVRNDSIMTKKPSYHRLYSLVVNYRYLLSVLLSGQYMQNVNQCIEKFAMELCGNIRSLNDILQKEHCNVNYNESPDLDFIFYSLRIGKYSEKKINTLVYEDGFIEWLKKAKGIVLYGAGNIGQIVYQYLHMVGMAKKIVSFAVTKKNNEMERIYQLPIQSIEMLSEKIKTENYLTILCVGEKLQDEIEDTCRYYGIVNILTIDKMLQFQISQRVKEAKKI